MNLHRITFMLLKGERGELYSAAKRLLKDTQGTRLLLLRFSLFEYLVLAKSLAMPLVLSVVQFSILSISLFSLYVCLSIPSDPIRSDGSYLSVVWAVRRNSIQFNSIQFNSIQLAFSILFCSVLFCSVLLFCFVFLQCRIYM